MVGWVLLVPGSRGRAGWGRGHPEPAPQPCLLPAARERAWLGGMELTSILPRHPL